MRRREFEHEPDHTNEAIPVDLSKVAAFEKSSVVGVLDVKTRSLVGIGAAVAMGAPASTYGPLVDQARVAGATIEECLGAYFAVASMVGAARVVTASPRIAAALGYDVEQALESG
jgi:4-carboxymuconolactone decarboxylase